MCHLNKITCKGQQLHPADCQLLAKAAHRPGSVLYVLNIEACRVDDMGAQCFTQTGSLKTLCIRKNNISDVAVQSLASGLAEGCLEVLNLKENRVTDVGALALSAVLGKCPNLRVLNLRKYKVTCEGAIALAKAIRSPDCSVKKLRLAHNSLRDGGASALAGILEQLEELDVEYNSMISESGKVALSNALEEAESRGLSPLLIVGPSSCTSSHVIAAK